jgi:hypothetical protein
MTPSERSWRSQLLASAGIEKETMRAPWIISAILVIVPGEYAGSADRRYSGRRVQVREGPRKSPTGFFRALIWRSLLQRTAGLLRIAMVPFTLVRCEP